MMAARSARCEDAIALRGVSYAYPGCAAPAIKGIDLTIPAGQCVIITGPSGCGKTTLSRVMNGLIPHVYEGAVSGEVRIDGTDTAQWTPDELGVRVGSVFQNPRSQFVNLDAASEIAFGCENLGLPREEIVARVDEAAHALGIEELLDCSVEELSGGQRQAVIIASAFAMHPDIFVLDEPTASLDVPSMQRLAQVVRALKEAGKTVIVSEHRLWWLADVADRVVLMEDGSIAGDWTAQAYAALPWDERLRAGMRAWTVDEMEAGMAAPVRQGEASEDGPSAGGLQARDLVVSYRRGAPVLDGLSLEACRGRILGIVGRNGVGKTTLLRTLAGLTRERAGEVSIGGSQVRFRDRPREVHLVMQEPGYQLFADSARSELDRSTPAEADRLLAAFGLIRCADRHPLSLSGGERQRLAIAAGLSRGVSALVLDEPTSGLDRANMERVAAALRQAAEEGSAIVLITHDHEFLCAVCDEVAEVADGRVFARYPLDEAHMGRVRSCFGF